MEKQNLSDNLTNSSTANELTLKESKPQNPNKTSAINDEFMHTTILKVEKCNHSFKRVRPNQVECNKCGFGFFDSPDNPFVLTK
jgi:hypothetical protein